MNVRLLIRLICVAIFAIYNTLTLTASNYNGSKLASGHWVKIATDNEGIYQLTYDELRLMGFDNPDQVQVYGYGAVQLTDNEFSPSLPDDIVPTATMHTGDGRILFFGQSDVSVEIDKVISTQGYTINRNYYDTRSYYFLSDAYGLSPIPITSCSVTSLLEGAYNAHIHVELYEEELDTPAKGGTAYHGHKCEPGENIEYNCRITDFAPYEDIDCGSFAYVVAAGAEKSSTFPITASDNVRVIDEQRFSAARLSQGDYKAFNDATGYIAFSPTERSNSDVRFTISIPSVYADEGHGLTYCAVDRAILRYPRTNRLESGRSSLLMNHIGNSSFAGAVHQIKVADDDQVVVWNIDRPYAISCYESRYDVDAKVVYYTFDKLTRRTIAFRPAASYPSPDIVGQLPNQNLHASATPDLLIITTSELENIAQRLAGLHRAYQSMDVNVVVHDDIYNEFSSGARDAMAYRRLAKMYYDRDPLKFKYILMFGASCYDNRCVSVPYVDRIISYQTTDKDLSCSLTVNYASDLYFGMLADDYVHADIASTMMQVSVGRVPAITPAQAQSYVDKVADRFANPPSAATFGRAMLLSGEGDENIHAKHQLEVERTIMTANPDFTVIPIHIQAFQPPKVPAVAAPHSIIESELNQGVGYLSYSGHGGQTFISYYHLLDTRKAGNFKYADAPFMMFSSCDQFSYDRLQGGLLETMLFNRYGGAIAGVAAGREVYITFNQSSCIPIAQAYASAKPGETFGEMFLRSRQFTFDMAGESAGMLVNAMSYNLGGDPALPIYAPKYKIKFVAIGNTDNGSESVIRPLTPTPLSGIIVDADDRQITDFKGSVSITVLDGLDTTSTLNTVGESNYRPIDIATEYNVLGQVSIKVEDGRFDGNIVVPFPTVPSAHYRVVAAAEDYDTGFTALGSTRELQIEDLASGEFDDADFGVPVILSLYAGDESFSNGDELPAVFDVTAIIDPSPVGLRMSSGDIAPHTNLIIDSRRRITDLNHCIMPLDDGRMMLHTTIDGLDDGRHNLAITVASNSGATTCASIDFTVVTHNLNASVIIDDQPARTSATIDIVGADNMTSNRVLINDPWGNTVFTATDVAFPYVWPLIDMAGHPVGNGRYSISVMLRDGNYYGSTPVTELVVVR